MSAEARLEGLVRDCHQAVLAYVRRRVRHEVVDDIVAETFLTAWRRLDDVPAEPLPWLLGVARNVIRTQHRSARRRESLGERLRSQPRDEGLPEPSWQEPERSPVLAALARLSERDREALTLIAWDGLSPCEAAAVLGVSPASFHVRLHRARRRFRLELDRVAPHLPHSLLGKEAFHE